MTRFSFSAHKLRHTSATVALAAGVNPLAISKLLNQSSMRTTEQYLHLIPAALAEARDLARTGLAPYTARAGGPPGMTRRPDALLERFVTCGKAFVTTRDRSKGDATMDQQVTARVYYRQG